MSQHFLCSARIDQGHTAALESSSTEAPTVNAIRLCHDIVKSDQLRAAALVVFDRAESALENQAAVCAEITVFPRFSSDLDTADFFEKMRCAFAERLR